MGTELLTLCFCAFSLVLALFVGISPISDKAKVWFMYIGAALSNRPCVHRRRMLLLLCHGEYGEIQCHEEKSGGA